MLTLRPNWGGERLPRPRRPAIELDEVPAWTDRVSAPDGCNPKPK